MRTAVIGVGAMGSLFASRLSRVADVVMIGNWPEQLAALRQRGLTVIQPDGRETRHQVRVTNDLNDVGQVQLALILVKSYQTERAAGQARHILAGDGLALTLQNGLGNLEQLALEVGESRAALGVTAQGATVVAPGILRHAGEGQTHLAQRPATVAQLTAVATLFCQAGFEAGLVEDERGLVWGKLAINAGINPLTALLGVTNGFLAEDDAARRVMSQAAQETADVARAQGIELPFESAAQRALEVSRATAANRSSMLQDISRQAPTEIDAISGVVVHFGQRFGVPTPVNEILWRLVRAAEAGQKVDLSQLRQVGARQQ